MIDAPGGVPEGDDGAQGGLRGDLSLAGEALILGQAAVMGAPLELAGGIEVGVAVEHTHGAATTDAFTSASATERQAGGVDGGEQGGSRGGRRIEVDVARRASEQVDPRHGVRERLSLT